MLFSPLFLVIAVAIHLDSLGPVFFLGERIGRNGVPFKIFKFRTLTRDAAVLGPGITTGNDTRVTRTGRFLRAVKLDELPQLINVLRGEMSLVGPRPEDPRYVNLYTPDQCKILEFRPGITSPASIEYRDESHMILEEDWERFYVEQVIPRKLVIDLEYFHRATLWSDLGVIARTFGALMGGKRN